VGGAAAAGRSGLGGAAAGGGLGLCEDTEFITRPVGTAAGAAGGGGLSLYEDTEFVSSRLAGASGAVGGSLGLCEDTEFITRPVAAAPAAAGAAGGRGGFGRTGLGGSSSVQQRLPDEASDSTTGLLRVKENLPSALGPRVGQQQQQPLRVPLGQAGSGAAGLAEHGSRFGQSGSAPNSPGAGM
jgi:hypothetical protein